MIRLFAALRTALRRDDGTATIEFVLCVPVIMTIALSSIEAGFLMTRSVMLDQAVDHTMRNIRLGHLVAPSPDEVKADICSRTSIIENCERDILVEMTPISNTAWQMPTEGAPCRDRVAEVNPPFSFTEGSSLQVTLVRVCVKQDAIFPGGFLGKNMARTGDLDGNGGYAIVAISAFVNEPT